MIPKIFLRKGKDDSAKRFHPWIFSGAIQCKEDINEGDIVAVYTANKQLLGKGYYSTGSIAVRMLSFDNSEIDETFWRKKINSAVVYRKSLGLIDNVQTNAFRLVHAEGDGIPGLIIDYYDGHLVVQFHTLGIFNLRFELLKALQNIENLKVNSIWFKSATPELSSILPEPDLVFGKEVDFHILENYIRFKVDIRTGQKTGLFLDQRENRKLLSNFCAYKDVLNTFCYTGAFSLYAMEAAAKSVVSIDSSKKALDGLKENAVLNGFGSYNHEIICADAVEYLNKITQTFDVVILDPPAFAKSLRSRHNAIQAYKRINKAGLKLVRLGGYLFTFSCSQVVTKTLFQSTVLAAAIEAGRKVRVVHQLQQGPDHPINIFHPEGEYLKGLVLYVE